MKYIEKTLNDTVTVTGLINLHFFEFSKDFYTEDEQHPFYELVYVATGKINIRSARYTGTLEKNELIIHYPDESHSLSCDNESVPTVIIIGFKCAGFDLKYLSEKPVPLSDGEIKNLAEIVKEGRNVFVPPYDVPTYNMKKKQNPVIGSEQLLKILLEYFLLKVVRRTTVKEERAHETTKDAITIHQIISYVSENYAEKATLDQLAFIFGTNRSTVCKEFRAATGLSINAFVKNVKLKKAREMLKDGNRSVTAIAELLGFESIHYFTRFFKKETGLSPLQYRKSRSPYAEPPV